MAVIAPDRSAPVVLILFAEALIDALEESVAAPSLGLVAVAVTENDALSVDSPCI